MRKLIGISLITALVAGLAVTSATGAEPQASASATNCTLTSKEQRNLGASYVTSLKVQGVSCGQGKSVTLAFHKCRTANGKPQGKCTRNVAGYACAEKRYDAVPGVQYSAKVTCASGQKRVFSTYTQNT